MGVPPEHEIVPAQPGGVHVHAIASFLGDDVADHRFWLVSRTGNRVELPADLAVFLRDAAATLAAGYGVRFAALPPRLRLRQAAELSGMSVERLREAAVRAGYHVAGAPGAEHLALAEVVELKRRERELREAALRELVADSEESGLYEVDGRDE